MRDWVSGHHQGDEDCRHHEGENEDAILSDLRVGDPFHPAEDGVEKDDRDRREEENGSVDDEVAPATEVRAPFISREDEEAKGDECEVGEVRSEVGGRLEFDRKRLVALPDRGKTLLAALDGAFGPAVLLVFETSHVDRELGGGLNFLEEDEFPALELGPVGEVHVLGEGVMLPAAGVFDGRLAPDATGSVKGKESAGAVSGGLLEFEVAVEEEGLHAGQGVVVTVEMTPAGLHEGNFIVGEMVDRFLEKIGVGNEVGVEDENIISLGLVHPVFESPGLISGAVGAMQAGGIKTLVAKAGGPGPGNFDGLVGGVVEDLDFELVLGVVEGGHGIEEAIDDMHLVEDGKLNGDEGHFLELAVGHGAFTPVFEVEIKDGQAVKAETGKGEKDGGIKSKPDPGGDVV